MPYLLQSQKNPISCILYSYSPFHSSTGSNERRTIIRSSGWRSNRIRSTRDSGKSIVAVTSWRAVARSICNGLGLTRLGLSLEVEVAVGSRRGQWEAWCRWGRSRKLVAFVSRKGGGSVASKCGRRSLVSSISWRSKRRSSSYQESSRRCSHGGLTVRYIDFIINLVK